MKTQFINVYSPSWYFLRTIMVRSKTDPEKTADRVKRIYARRLFKGVQTICN